MSEQTGLTYVSLGKVRQGSSRLEQDKQVYERLKDEWLAPVEESPVPPNLLKAARALEQKLEEAAISENSVESPAIRSRSIAPAHPQTPAG